MIAKHMLEAAKRNHHTDKPHPKSRYKNCFLVSRNIGNLQMIDLKISKFVDYFLSFTIFR